MHAKILEMVGRLHGVELLARNRIRGQILKEYRDSLSGLDLVRLYDQPGSACPCASCLAAFGFRDESEKVLLQPRPQPPPVLVQPAYHGESDGGGVAGTGIPSDQFPPCDEVPPPRSEGYPHQARGGGAVAGKTS